MSEVSSSPSRAPSTEQEIHAARIGPPRRLDGPIVLVEHDAGWAALFDREAARIAGLLADRALRLEHVGSTAVPDLPAKPIIDIVLVVADSADEPAYVPVLEGAGYVLRVREPGWHEHRVLKGPDTDVNLHVFSAGCTEVERMVTFRDHLRRDEGDRRLYADTKRELARRTWTYTQQYADAKTAVVDEIMSRASHARP